VSDNVICSDQRHLIDRPVPEGITGIYLFKYEAEQALTSSASCDLPSSYGLSWQTNATGEWEFEWERPGGYGCGCPSAFWIKAEHLQFLNYLTSLIAPTGTAPQEAQADPQQEVYWLTDPENPVTKAPFVRAPVPQTEGECPQCGGEGVVVLGGPSALALEDYGVDAERDDCPTCSGKGEK